MTENYIQNITGDINGGVTVTGNMSLINKTKDIIINGNSSITNNLLTNSNNLSINGNINSTNTTLTGNVDLSGNIVGNVNGNVDISGNIIGNVSGDITNNVINVTGNVFTGIYGTNQFNDFTITGKMSSASLSVSGNSGISGNLDLSGNMNVSNNKFTVASNTGNTNILGSLQVTGPTTLINNVGISNNLDLSGNMNVGGNNFIVNSNGNTSVAGTLNVTGNTTVNGNTNLNGSVINVGTTNSIVNIGGNNSTVNILGSTNLIETTNLQIKDKIITLNKNGTVNSSGGSGIEFEENNIITGYIKVSDDRNYYNVKMPNNNTIYTLSLTDPSGNVNITGNNNITGLLNVGDNTGISGNLDLSGNMNIASNKFTVDKTTGNTNINGTLNVNSATTLVGDTGMSGNLNLTGNMNVGNNKLNFITSTGKLGINNNNPTYNLDVTGNGRFTNGINILGAAILNGNTSVGGTLNVTGTSTLSSNTSIGGTLGVTGTTSLSGTTTINSSLKVIGDNVIGIGTANPLGGNYNFRLHAVGNNPIIGLQSGNGYDSIVGLQAYNNGMYLGNFYDTGLLPTLFVGNDGNIGIGTTAPSNKLSVIGNANISGTLGVTSNTNIGGTLGVTGNTTLSGNVGIGTASPFTKLDVIGTSTITDLAPELLFRPTNAAWWAIQAKNLGNLQFGTTDGTGIINNTTLTITNGGNLGIGITSPSYPLEVNGAIVTSNKIGNGGNGVNTFITSGNGSFGTIECTNNLNTGKLPLNLQAYGGNVGIGMTNPNYKLDVNGIFHTNTFPLLLGTATDTTAVRMINSLDSSMTNASSRWICWGKDATINNSCELQYYHATDNSTENTMTLGFNNNRVMYIKAGGRVGIQTDNPLYNLDVNGNCKIKNELYVGDPAGVGTIYMGGGAVGDGAYNHSVIETRNYAGSESTELLLFKGNDWENASGPDRIRLRASNIVFDTYNYTTVDRGAENIRMLINQDGNVGIGTTTPQNKLDIVGGMNITRAGPAITCRTDSNIYPCSFIDINGYNLNGRALFGVDGYGFGNISTGATLMASWTNNPVIIATNTTEKMRITESGYVGIGTSYPSYPLHVSGYNVTYINPFTYYARTPEGYSWIDGAGGTGIAVSICASNCIYTGDRVVGAEFDALSDTRIKTNIIDINDDYALSILRQIQPKTYEYIDKFKKGNNSVIGFIAQEIKAILPKAVTTMINYIPNFYTLCQVIPTDISNNLLITSPIDLSWNSLHDLSGNAYIDNSGNACSDASGNKFFNIKLYDSSNNEIICKTKNIIDSKNFIIDVSGTQFIDICGNIIIKDGYFLYGQEVDDFHTIDKNAIFTVVTAAVQDIDRKQQQDANDIVVLKQQISSLQTENVSLVNKVTDLESRLSKLEEIINNLNK